VTGGVIVDGNNIFEFDVFDGHVTIAWVGQGSVCLPIEVFGRIVEALQGEE
jgi:hypothetical protein